MVKTLEVQIVDRLFNDLNTLLADSDLDGENKVEKLCQNLLMQWVALNFNKLYALPSEKNPHIGQSAISTEKPVST